MPISDFTNEVENNVSRQGEAFVRPVGGSFAHMGQVKNLELTASPVQSEQDTAGRQKQLAHDVELSFVLQQTSDTEIGATDSLLDQEVDIAFTTETGLSPGEVNAGENAYRFDAFLVSIEGEINFMGDESMLTATSAARCSVGEFASLGSNGVMRAGD